MKRVLVVGSGAIGLRTALELATRQQLRVKLFSPRHPLHPSTCSMGAGGLWMPFHCDDPRTDRWAAETLDELLAYVAKGGKRDGERLVEIVPTVKLRKEMTSSAALGAWTSDPRLKFQQLTVDMLSQQNEAHRLRIPSHQELLDAAYTHAQLFFPPIVNSTLMLAHLLEKASEVLEEVDVPSLATDEAPKMLESLDDVMEMAAKKSCDAVVNCTGLGSRQLCQDEQVLGARGILLNYDRRSVERRSSFMENVGNQTNTNDAAILAEDAPWGSATMPCYLIPRGSTICLGGSYLEQDMRETVTEEERARLCQNAFHLGIDVRKSTPTQEWVGFRPYRARVRCEADPSYSNSPIQLIHNYGHGGSGWTVNVGAAKECASLVQSALNQ